MFHRINFLGCPLDVASMDETVDVIEQHVSKRNFIQHVVVNVAKLVTMRKDPFLDESVKSSDIINIDGMGVVIGARLLGHDIPERVAGVDLFHNLLAMSARNKFPVFLLGATEEVVTKTRETIESSYPDLIVAGSQHGYFWDYEEQVVENIADSGARLLFVAITSPKKENFINKWKNQLGVDFVMGVGGTFDVVAGKVERAPKWMQSSGLEWLYRLLQEPGRMWKRYLITNVQFAILLLRATLGFKIEYSHAENKDAIANENTANKG